MHTTYDPDELTDQFNRYDELKEATYNRCIEDIGDPDESNWNLTNVWDYAQDEYYDYQYDSTEEHAKFADAAYRQAESNLSDPDWSNVKERITDFVLPQHVDVSHSDDMPDYLPGSYTQLATQEIVVHAISLELVRGQ